MIENLVEQAERLSAGGQIEQAKDRYAQICQLAPHRARYWFRLAELQFDLERFCRRSARAGIRVTAEPLNPSALLLATAALLETGGYEQAAQLADQVLDLDGVGGGNRLAALSNKSMALLRLGRFDDALAAVDLALISMKGRRRGIRTGVRPC